MSDDPYKAPKAERLVERNSRRPLIVALALAAAVLFGLGLWLMLPVNDYVSPPIRKTSSKDVAGPSTEDNSGLSETK